MQQEIQTATAGQTVFDLTTMQYQPGTNSLSVFVDGVNQYGPGAQYAYVETDSDTVTFVSGLHEGASVKFTTAASVSSNYANADQVTYDPPFTDAVATNVEAKLSQYVSALDFGAAGDGVTDDTTYLQNAIDALETNQILDGLNKTYITTTLNLKSDMVMQNFYFVTKSGSGDFVAPITIDGTSVAKSNITLINVNVDGNRFNQSGPYSPTEDGGRHGFRCVGFVSNLKLLNCSANYCATDGISLFSSTSKPAADTYSGLCYQNIYMEGCTFNWNRRNGMSFDSVNGIKIIGCNAKNNGKDIDGTAPGAPFDFEGYGVGTAINEVEIIGGDFTENAGKALINDSVNPASVGFLPRQNIRITNARFDVPNSALDGCISIYGPNTNVGSNLYVYKNIEMTGCRFDNWIEINGVNGLSVYGGSVNGDYATNTYFANVNKSKNWHFSLRSTTPLVSYDTLPFTLTRTDVIGTPTYASVSNNLIGFTASGWLMQYTATVTGSVRQYYSTFALSTGYRLGNVSGAFENNTQPAVTGYFITRSTATPTTIVATYQIQNADNYSISIIYEVLPYNA